MYFLSYRPAMVGELYTCTQMVPMCQSSHMLIWQVLSLQEFYHCKELIGHVLPEPVYSEVSKGCVTTLGRVHDLL